MKYKKDVTHLILKQLWNTHHINNWKIRVPFLNRNKSFKIFGYKQLLWADEISKESHLLYRWWNWYITFTAFFEKPNIEKKLHWIIGIDIGLKDQFTIYLWWNKCVKLKFDWLKKAESEVAYYQSKLAKMKNRIKKLNDWKFIYSHNYHKQNVKYKKALLRRHNLKLEREQKIRHILKLFHVCSETINIQIWQKLWGRKTQSIRLGRITWAAYTTQISSSKVWRFYASTKICSWCWHKKKKIWLDERVYCCEKCGVSLDRDWNAAKNILFEWTKNLPTEVVDRILPLDWGCRSVENNTSELVQVLENACIGHLVQVKVCSLEAENSNREVRSS